MMTTPTVGIYNYRTEETEYKALPLDSWRDYIPQIPPALALYDLYTQDMGLSPNEAAKRILLQFVKKEGE